MTSDFLAGLDAAVEGRCACLCGEPITAASPSAYFASEMCAELWHQRRRPPAQTRAASAAALQGLFEHVAAAARPLVAALAALAEALNRSLREAADALAGAGRPAGEPATPRWAATSRPPRRVDPPGGLRTARRGRAPFQPRLR